MADPGVTPSPAAATARDAGRRSATPRGRGSRGSSPIPARRRRLAGAAGLTVAALLLGGSPARSDEGPVPSAPPSSPVTFSIGRELLTFTDPERVLRIGRRPPSPRTLVTYIRYPRTTAPAGRPDDPAAPRPLIVFAHGYDVSPSVYDQLLDAWAHHGYVVAAPVFPRERPQAPGGTTRSDLDNEPSDVSLVIDQLLALSATPGHPLSGRIDPLHIAVAGHSDGGIVALEVAYGRHHRDRRIAAAVVLSGARPDDGPLLFGPQSAPLLASVGTSDTTNRPANTLAYYRLARRPKFLLRLMGASHLPPFSYAQPWLGVVERVSSAFLDTYLGAGSRSGPPPQFGPLPTSALLDAQP